MSVPHFEQADEDARCRQGGGPNAPANRARDRGRPAAGATGGADLVGVLSIGKLTARQERYYEQPVAHGRDDYYSGRGEAPGRWT